MKVKKSKKKVERNRLDLFIEIYYSYDKVDYKKIDY